MAQIGSSSGSFPTKPAFIHEGDWDSASDQHPACKFMRDYTNDWDNGDRKSMWGRLVTDDFQFAKGDGQIFQPGRQSWDAVLDAYSVFTKTHHKPYFFAVWERDDGTGWELSGNAYLQANVVGQPDAEPAYKDGGNSWEVKIPSGFYFKYLKGSDGSIKLQSMAITGDSGPVVLKLLARGVLTPAQLGL